MPMIRVNGTELFYESSGDGYPLVIVHGSWSDHHTWMEAVAGLAKHFRVIAYDRRGHGHSEKPGSGTRRDDEDDLAGLLTELDIAPAHVVGNSFGGSTALGLATRRPEIFRSIAVHEPPLMGIVDDSEVRVLIDENEAKVDGVVQLIRSGDAALGARKFVEEVIAGPGAWDQMPEPMRNMFVSNAGTFAEEQSDPHWSALNLDALARFVGPALLTGGDQSPPWFSVVLDKLASTFKKAQRRTLTGAGHIPHVTNADDYAATITEFVKRAA